MDKICKYCQALKFSNEATGMCCVSGKVVLSPLPTPPETLKSLLAEESEDSKLFLCKARKFNSRFQITSFGATNICDLTSDRYHFETTFKIQDQDWFTNTDDPKFLQIYFMGSCEERMNMHVH